MLNNNNIHLCVALAVLCLSCSFAAVLTARQLCLDSLGGEVSCSFENEVTLPATLTRAACSASDYNCLCLKAIEYNTAIRTKHGLGPVPPGSASMLANAIKHSESYTDGSFDHQDLQKATSDVSVTFFARVKISPSSAARPMILPRSAWTCGKTRRVNLANILSDNSMTVIGIFQKNGWTYCTQTIGLDGHGVGSRSGAQ
jgi:hypothetical protein